MSITVPSPREVTQRGFEAIVTRDLDTFAAVRHPDATTEFVALELTCRGPDEVCAFYRELYEAYPDFHIEALGITVEGNTGIVEWDSRGTFTGRPFQGSAPPVVRSALGA